MAIINRKSQYLLQTFGKIRKYHCNNANKQLDNAFINIRFKGQANYLYTGWFRFMMFNATFNNISVTSWRSALLVEETGLPGENHIPVASHRQTE